jgi:hypothetical protein
MVAAMKGRIMIARMKAAVKMPVPTAQLLTKMTQTVK